MKNKTAPLGARVKLLLPILVLVARTEEVDGESEKNKGSETNTSAEFHVTPF